eukprot:SAG31_NODE_4065_length_3623_cov_4.472758_2_plen_720_part_00
MIEIDFVFFLTKNHFFTTDDRSSVRSAPWTTRPELRGTFGMVASSHYLASAAGMQILEAGGNAFDAAVACGAMLWHTCPADLSPGGEVPIVFHSARAPGKISTISGQGTMPAAATLGRYADLGLKHPEQRMPGHGMLAATVPGAFDAWMLLLSIQGTLRPRDVLQPFVKCCHDGVPISHDVYNTLGRKAKFMFEHWPTSAATYLDEHGNPPPLGGLWKNETMGATFDRLLSEAEEVVNGAGSSAPHAGSEAQRQAEIAAIRRIWSTGFIAEAVAAHCKVAWRNDRTGTDEIGLITLEDMAKYEAKLEPAVTYEYCGWTVGKCGPWSQGPVFLQQLALLKGVEGFHKMAPDSPEFVHTVVESTKLAMADRTAYYSDPDFVDVPLDVLLSDEYNDARRKLIDPKKAAAGLIPGVATGPKIDGAGDASHLLGSSVRKMYEDATAEARVAQLEAENAQLREKVAAAKAVLESSGRSGGVAAAGTSASGGDGSSTDDGGSIRGIVHPYFDSEDSYSDTIYDPIYKRDTVHLCASDRHGNMCSATPSGGFMYAAPCVGELGFPTSTRGLMCTLEPGCVNTLQPGIRPRTTLSPTVALRDGKPDCGLAFGTPGTDGQDQWTLSFFLRHVHHGMAPQASIDHPSFSSHHFPSSYGGRASPLVLDVEGRMPAATANKLRALGHKVNHKPGRWEESHWGEGKINCCGVDCGQVLGAANARGMVGYAVGR